MFLRYVHHELLSKKQNNNIEQGDSIHNITASLPDVMACEDFPLSGPEGSGPIPESSIGGRSNSGFGPYGPLPSTPCNGMQQMKHVHTELKDLSIMKRK
jgi:hypothetical protein